MLIDPPKRVLEHPMLMGRPFRVRKSSRTTRSEKSAFGRTDDVDSWKASFLRAGVYPEKAGGSMNGGENEVCIRYVNVSQGLRNVFEQGRDLI